MSEAVAADVFVARSGKRLIIRPMRPDDAGREQGFVRGLSDRSRRLRFLSRLKELPPRLLHRFTHPDPERETVLVAVDPESERFVAVARYIILSGTEAEGGSCEFALTVADGWQGDGIGRHLMQRLIEDARARALARIEGIVLCENLRMQRLMIDLGFEVRRNPNDFSTWRVWKDLHERGAPM